MIFSRLASRRAFIMNEFMCAKLLTALLLPFTSPKKVKCCDDRKANKIFADRSVVRSWYFYQRIKLAFDWNKLWLYDCLHCDTHGKRQTANFRWWCSPGRLALYKTPKRALGCLCRSPYHCHISGARRGDPLSPEKCRLRRVRIRIIISSISRIRIIFINTVHVTSPKIQY